MIENDSETEKFVVRAQSGDTSAVTQLINKHRQRLRQMVAVRMNDRLLARFDPSDVVQEAMIDAVRKLPDYLNERPLPFYLWLRRIAWNRLVDLHRAHVISARRSVKREVSFDSPLSNESHLRLVDRLFSHDESPAAKSLREELVTQLRQAITLLNPSQREVLILRHLECLSVGEVAQILKTTESAVTSRHFRALARLRELFGHLQ